MLLARAQTFARGGPRRVSRGSQDTGILVDALGAHAQIVINLGGYENISVTHQPDGKALVKLVPLINKLLAISPSGELSVAALKRALGQMVFQEPSLNASIYNNQLWASLRQERITCVMNHVRRLAREDDRCRLIFKYGCLKKKTCLMVFFI